MWGFEAALRKQSGGLFLAAGKHKPRPHAQFGEQAGSGLCGESLSLRQAKKAPFTGAFLLGDYRCGDSKGGKAKHPVDALPASGSAADQTAQYEVQAVCR